jgi:methylase of polypeptide subunit release factors
LWGALLQALPARIVVTAQEPLAELLRYLKAADYQFSTVTPATHARVLARPQNGPVSLRDIFGWNRHFGRSDISSNALDLLRAADALEEADGMLRSKVRVATLGEDLLLHSAFPTDDVNAVFFGPDTYRFARFVREQLPRGGVRRWLVDMGAGSGAGAIASAKSRGNDRVTMVDLNALALKLAAINVEVAGIQAETLVSDTIPEGAELVIANPPYMVDPAGRTYRHGGNLLGGAVALDWVKQALQRLAPRGMMLLYTGVAYANGEAPLLGQLALACSRAEASMTVQEIDPDVFGDELSQPSYARVERIAAVGVTIRSK